MTIRFKQWDPTKCISDIGGVTPRAYADGDMISVEYAVDKRSMHIGVDGAGRHMKSANLSGIYTVRMASYSPTVAAFQALDDLDVPFSIALADKSSNGDGFFAASCTLVKIPPMVKGETETVLEYGFQFTQGKIVRAGSEAAALISALQSLVG